MRTITARRNKPEYGRRGKCAAACVVAVVVLLSALCFAACDDVVPIEDVDWRFAIRQSADGTVTLASSDMKPFYPDARQGEVSIEISGGAITVSDDSARTLAQGVYRLEDKNGMRAVYLFRSGGVDWTAVVSVTKHWDMHEGTLIVSNGEISYTFTADVTRLSDRHRICALL